MGSEKYIGAAIFENLLHCILFFLFYSKMSFSAYKSNTNCKEKFRKMQKSIKKKIKPIN